MGDDANRLDTGHQRLTRTLGGGVALAALLILSLRMAGVELDALLPDMAQLSWTTLLGFILAGAALWGCQRPHPRLGYRLHLALTLALAGLAGGMLLVYLAGGPPGTWSPLSAPSTAFALLLAAAALWLLQRRTSRTILLVSLLVYLVAMLALYGLASLWVGFDPLLGWSATLHMTAYTAGGLLLIALAIAAQVFLSEQHAPSRNSLTFAGIAVAMSTSLFVAMAMTAVTTRHLVDARQAVLGQMLHERSVILEQMLERRLQEVAALAQRLMHIIGTDAPKGMGLNEVMPLLAKTTDYHALALLDAKGRRLGGFGAALPPGGMALPLRTGLPARLVWDGTTSLVVEAPVPGAGGEAGTLQVWLPLAALGTTINDLHGLGRSGELMICGEGVAGQIFCLPSRHRGQPFAAQAGVGGQPLPIGLALAGETGTVAAHDYRAVHVLAAYGPLAATGLGMVIKQDTDEFYPALLRDLAPLPLLWLGLLGLGFILMRLQVMPLVNAMGRAEQRYRSLVESSSDWIWEVDTAGRYTYASPMVTRLLGYTPEEVLGKSPFDLMPAAEAARVQALFAESVAARHPFFGLENVNRHRDGHEVVLETSGVPAFDGHGRWIGYRGIDRDITERRQLEQELRQSEQMYRTLVQGASDGIVLLSVDRRFIELNAAACRILGGARDQLLGLRPDDLLVPEDIPGMQEAMWALQEGGSVLSQRRLHRFDGREIVVEISSQGLADGSAISLLRDITERQRIEQALRHSRRELQRVLDNMRDCYMRLNLDGRFLRISPAVTRLLGYTPEEVLHLDFQTLCGGGGNSWEALRAALRHAGGELLDHELPALRKDGQAVWISLNAYHDYDETNQLRGIEGIARDVTEKRTSREAILESRDRLRSLSSHLQQVREEEKALIARELHDELGSTLTALKMDSAWLHDRLPAEQTELRIKVDAMTALLDVAVVALRRIVTQLRPTVLDDLGLWAAIEWQVREFNRYSGTPCELSISCDDLVVAPDQALAVFRIVQEALTNIARHSKAEQVWLDCWQDDGAVRITVQDDGVGLNESMPLRPDSHGMRGMYERIGEVGGHLEILGTKDEGTVVSIMLPRQDEGEV